MLYSVSLFLQNEPKQIIEINAWIRLVWFIFIDAFNQILTRPQHHEAVLDLSQFFS